MISLERGDRAYQSLIIGLPPTMQALLDLASALIRCSLAFLRGPAELA